MMGNTKDKNTKRNNINSNLCKISKEKFLKILSVLQNSIDYDYECSKIITKYNMDSAEPNTSYLSNYVTELLDMMLDVDYANGGYGDVSYFVNELDFGRNCDSDSAVALVCEDGFHNVDLSTPEKLWEYLQKKSDLK